MNERIFNLFPFVVKGLIREIGVTVHERGGNDMSKMKFLQSRVKDDVAKCRRFAVPSHFVVVHGNGLSEAGVLTHQMLNDLSRANKEAGVFEDLFAAVGASRDPMVCITPVSDGAIPRIDVVQKTAYSLALESGQLPHGVNPQPPK